MLSLLLLMLSSFASCRMLHRDSAVTRETLFNAITNEAYDTLLSVAPFPSGYNADPLNLTLAMQLSVLSGSAENVAWLLTNYNDSRALGLGLRFPPELRERALQTTDERVNDGDVVVMKGIAMAALDPSLASRLSDVYTFATYGAPFLDRMCTTEDPPVFDDQGVPDCHTQIILDFINARQIKTFEDTEDMKRIIASDPDITIFGFRGDELSALQPNVNWWPCAYCYEESFCLAHAINCPFEEETDMASLFQPMMSMIAPAADEDLEEA